MSERSTNLLLPLIFLLATLSVPARAAADEATDIPLTVFERSGVARDGVVVTSGVPLARGRHFTVDELVVVDAAGNPVPTQVSVLSRWWKPAHDDSLRWVRVSFPCRVGRAESAGYRLVERKTVTNAHADPNDPKALRVTQTDGAIEIATGAASFTVPRRGARLLSSARIGETELLDAGGLKAVVTGASWPAMKMKAGVFYRAVNAAVTVEESGPVRAVVRFDGSFVGNGEGAFNGALYRFVARLYFTTGSPTVRVVFTIKNSHLADHVYTWPINDLSLSAHVQVGDAPRARFLGERAPVQVDLHRWPNATMYQDSSGGDEWREFAKKKNYARWLSRYTEGKFIRGVQFRGYRVQSPAGILEQGNQARGVMDLAGGRGGVVIAQRNFRVRYPGAMTAARTIARVGLWPGEFTEPLFLSPGQRLTRELTITFRGPADKAPDLGAAYAALDRRLLFLAPAAWYAATGAWDAGLAAHTASGGRAPTRRRVTPSAPRTPERDATEERNADDGARGGDRSGDDGPTATRNPNVKQTPPWKRRGSTRIVPLPGSATHPSRLTRRPGIDVGKNPTGGQPAGAPNAGNAAPSPEGNSALAALRGNAPQPNRPRANAARVPAALGGGYDKRALDGVDVGWDWYGWIPGYNMGGAHWNQMTCFAETILHSDFASFDRAEARALWASDTALLHFDPTNLDRYWLKLNGYYWRDVGIEYHKCPGWYDRPQWREPNKGHMGMFMWFEYYNLTGDRRVLDSCLALGQRARAHLWKYNHDDVNGAGKAGNKVGWCRKRNPDDPEFRLHHRENGWPLYNLVLLYQLTGDQQILRECATVAAGFRNTMRWSPFGFLTTWMNKPGSKDMYGGQLTTGPPRTDSVSMLFAHFHAGVCATALVQYYRETLDEDALDTLIGFADFYTHQVMLRDQNGAMRGWSYVFGDYWGPHSMKDVDPRWPPNWLNQNFRIMQPLGWIYMLTGRDDHREVLRAGLAGLRGTGKKVMAAVQALATDRPDHAPPGAITDLAATVDGATVTLAWTAPGGDGAADGAGGRATRYQVKHSPSPIVERVSGWPDRSPPLPMTREDWERKAAAFRANQRAFWAVHNVSGEPVPSASGQRERFAVTLASGTHYLAIKSYDAAGNMSALSNVVKVTVP